MKYDANTVKSWVGSSTLWTCRADLAQFRQHGYSGWGTEEFWTLKMYRIQSEIQRCRPKWCWLPVKMVLAVVKKIFAFFMHIDLSAYAQIGPGLVIPHAGERRVHSATKMSADWAIHHMCTIGAGPTPGGAVIGDHVFIGCDSTRLGTVTIGDDTIVAANSLIMSDVPAGATAIGVPARILSAMTDGMTPRRGDASISSASRLESQRA